MVLGLVLHSSHQDRLVEASGMLTGVQLELVIYEQEREIRPKVKALLRRVQLDGMILGLVPYDACRDFLPPDLPLSVTRYTTLEWSPRRWASRICWTASRRNCPVGSGSGSRSAER